jgi:L-2-hydroxyglutarate oxidase
MKYDYCVIGGGIVGLATAMAILKARPGSSLLLIEKESGLARHQTGHNSGVIHAGVYYAPGSLKARFCKAGNRATKDFCDEAGVPYDNCGKIVVATNAREIDRLQGLEERSSSNDLKIRRLSGGELRELEPNITGLGGLFVESTAIVDFHQVASAYADRIAQLGGEIRFGSEVVRIREDPAGVEIVSADTAIQAQKLVVCAGLQSDRLARMAGLNVDFRIIPFRGDYYALDQRFGGFVKHLIYPGPDPELPFLGIHLTLMIDGRITVGPNAALGLGRECYDRMKFSVADMADYLKFPGFWRLLRDNWQSSLSEIRRSAFKAQFLAECRKYAPEIELEDLIPHPAGIRAQAVTRDGKLVHDFLMLQSDRMLHVCNAPSPAATAAIPIGAAIAEKIVG